MQSSDVRSSEGDRSKRCFDVVAGIGLLIITCPVQLIIALLVRRNLGRPVLFRQERPGKDGRTFELIKFRSMRSPDPRRGLVTDAQRLTRFGTVLRSTSLDELPSLWNVIKGDMSFVGPRPLLVEYLPLYSPRQARRHEVRPGLTGLAQVSGRNALSWQERFELDVEYVEKRSLLVDARIVLRTVAMVLRRDGISDAAGPTMTAFTGSSGDEEPQTGTADRTARSEPSGKPDAIRAAGKEA